MNTVTHFYKKIENEREDIFLLGLIKIKKNARQCLDKKLMDLH